VEDKWKEWKKRSTGVEKDLVSLERKHWEKYERNEGLVVKNRVNPKERRGQRRVKERFMIWVVLSFGLATANIYHPIPNAISL